MRTMQRYWIIMRHAEAQHNVYSRYNSDPTHPSYTESYLTPRGEDQVRDAAEELLKLGITAESVGRAIVSPLPRTQRTCEILTEHGVLLPDCVTIDERVIEVRMGSREGALHRTEVETWNLPALPEYDGESDEEVMARMASVADEINQEPPEGHILVVTHGYPAMEMIAHLTGEREQLPVCGFRLSPVCVQQR